MSEKIWSTRSLTVGEKELIHALFGTVINYEPVRIIREKYAFFHPRNTTMAPNGQIWIHPDGGLAKCRAVEDFSKASLDFREHFVHEMTHVWQFQHGIDPILQKALMFFRHGFKGGYDYKLVSGKKFTAYNIEQQACIVADIYVARCQIKVFDGIPAGTPVV